MIAKVWNSGEVIWQDFVEQGDICNPAILLHLDSGGSIVMNQEGREIVLTPQSVPELIGALKTMHKTAMTPVKGRA